MNWIAWKMLTGDRAKYWGIVFGVAFGTLLICQQSSIFVGLMRRTSSVIIDTTEGDLWVMDRDAENADDIRPLPETRLHRVRSVEGVDWAVRFFRSQTRVRREDGRFRVALLLGLDDATLIGAPRNMLHGTLADLHKPNAVIVDEPGYSYLFPNEPVRLPRELEMNDRRAVVVGVCKVTQPFITFPVIYARYSEAVGYVAQERNALSFVIAKARAHVSPEELKDRINADPNLKSFTNDEFFWFNIGYFMRSTGIPVNFGITVSLGFIVGAAIAGQTFYLFTLENLKQFGSLKAMGVNNMRLLGMILFQAAVVGTVGYGIGMGMATLFFEVMNRLPNPALRGMYIPWQIALITACAVGGIVFLASLLSARRLIVLAPAEVFK